MPGESIVIKINAEGSYYETIKKLSTVTKAFDKDVDALEDTLVDLSKQKAPLSAALKAAQKELAAATEQFNASGDAASRMTMEMAQVKVDTIRRNLSLVNKAARETEKQFNNLGKSSQKSSERMKLDAAGVVKAISTSGLKDVLVDLGKSASIAFMGSAFGDDAGNIFSNGLNGAISGVMAGFMVGGVPGALVGAALGGGLGAASGNLQNRQAQDEAFKSYYTGLYDEKKAQRETGVSSGSATAGQREKDEISFTTLFGDRQTAENYLSGLVDMANTTPFLYDDLTAMSKTLATYGYGADTILPVLQTVGDTGAALGMSTGDMSAVATALGRMKSSDKATLEYLNILNDRGIGAVGYLAEAKGVSVGKTYDMISKGQISGTEAVEIILKAIETDFSGAMKEQSQTFSGLSSTLEGLKQEVDNAAGEGYNGLRKTGMEEEISAWGGELGAAMRELNRISGENAAYLENLGEQYRREALSALLLGTDAGLYGTEDQRQLGEMRQKYLEASADYENAGTDVNAKQLAALKMEELSIQAEGIAKAAFEASDQYKLTQQAEAESLAALRENTSALEAASAAYSLAQERTKGAAAGRGGADGLINTLADGISNEAGRAGFSTGDGEAEPTLFTKSPQNQNTAGLTAGYELGGWSSDAFGLARVPYDNFPALLHQGERVLTASEARAQDRGGGAPEGNASGIMAGYELSGWSSDAFGLARVPYDNFPALLHQGERVLTARETRLMDRKTERLRETERLTERERFPFPLPAREARPEPGAPAANQSAVNSISITVSGNTFGAGMDEAAVAKALADQIMLQLEAGGGRL